MKYNVVNAEEASKRTFDAPMNSGLNAQIAYNKATGEVIVTEHASASNWTRYSDPDIVTIGYVVKHLSADKIVSMVNDAMNMISGD